MAPLSAARSAKHQRPLRSLELCLSALILLLVSAAEPKSPRIGQPEATEKSTAAEPARQVGRLIRVPLPITGSVDIQVKRAVQRALSMTPPGGARPVLIFEFSPGQNKFGEGSEFGRALDLARYLSSRELSTAKTVAYIPRSIKGHAVLVALACEQLVMAPDAEIGDAGVDEKASEAISPAIRSGYSDIANSRRTVPPEVALGMLDKNVEVLKVETEVSPEYVLRSDLEKLRAKHNIQSEEVLIRAGELGRFSGREARRLGFVKFLAPDRSAVAKALGLPPESLEEDPSQGGDWRPLRVPLKGNVTAQLVSRVQRIIEDQIRDRDVNFVCIWIDSPGGSPGDSMTLANFLAGLDPARVRTVAYIPREARSDAALVALACDQTVMHRSAILGGSGALNLAPEDVRLARETVRDTLASRKSRSWSLPAALIDPNLKVFSYRHKTKGIVDHFCEEELQSQQEPDAWVRGDEVTRTGSPLRVLGDRAEELGLARHLVENFQQFKQIYGLENELALVEPGWADYLIDALASDAFAWMLLLIGGASLYAELQAPGIGVGGFIAGISFLLYFWAKHLNGTAGWLEVLLFGAGVCCVLLEIFVLPGAAIFGLGGGLLIIFSLVLASQTFVIPHNDYQIGRLRDSMLGFFGVGVGVVLAAMVMRRFLPHSPMFGHMVLEPPTHEELEDLSHREALVEFDHLLGEQGVTTTQLTPSGKARFGSELVDVIADGEVIGRGAEVTVVQVQGNRVVVRSLANRA